MSHLIVQLKKKRPSGRMECQLSWVYGRMSSDLVVRDGRLYRRSPRRITLWKERVCPECYRFYLQHLPHVLLLNIFRFSFSLRISLPLFIYSNFFFFLSPCPSALYL